MGAEGIVFIQDGKGSRKKSFFGFSFFIWYCVPHFFLLGVRGVRAGPLRKEEFFFNSEKMWPLRGGGGKPLRKLFLRLL